MNTDDFRYDYFPIPDRFKRGYYGHLQRGLQKCSQLNVVICGCARNVADTLPKTVARVNSLGRLFFDYRVVVFENDSADLTRMSLDGWAAKDRRVSILGRDRGDPVNSQIRCLQRTARMAYYRNAVRKHIVDKYSDWASHVIVADMDLEGGWSREGVAHTFSSTGWDFVGSNCVLFRQYGEEKNKPVYFDVWAFRWLGSDEPTKPLDINPLYWDRGSDLLPVNSCFGGLGVYRIEAFQRCSYDGSDCEHVPFHRKMRQNGMGRLFMNPSQVVHYGGQPIWKNDGGD